MVTRKREGNRPDRRIAPQEATCPNVRVALKTQVRYVGSANHKLHPGNYGFVPPNNPRPSKSPCDEIRPVLIEEARALFERGIDLGMVSRFPDGGVPKYVWAVDEHGEVYEAKTKSDLELVYHGYRIGADEGKMRGYILDEWRRRCLNH